WFGTGNVFITLRAMTELTFLAVFTLALYCLRPWSSAISKSRAWAPLAALGTISYSLYLIHQFNLHATHYLALRLTPFNSPAVLISMVQTLLLVAFAAVFWYCCERPFMRRPVPVPRPRVDLPAKAQLS